MPYHTKFLDERRNICYDILTFQDEQFTQGNVQDG